MTLLTSVLMSLLATLLLPGPAPPAGLGEVPAGDAVWPLAPVPGVVEGFDPPTSRWGAGHRGVDLAGSPGQQVRAARPGTVAFAGSLAGRGVVVVDHGATRTTYEPVDAAVGVGDTVAAGDPLGSLQRGGSHCFPAACLHWGLLAGETYLDPLSLVGAGPVRLLPLGADAVGAVDRRSARLPDRARDAPMSATGPPVLAPRGAGALFRDGRVRRAGEPGGTPAAAGRW